MNPIESGRRIPRILVVEDMNSSRANLAAAFLQHFEDIYSDGLEVLEAACGDEFEARFKYVDAILLGCGMPKQLYEPEVKTEGLDRLLALRTRHPGHKALENLVVRTASRKSDFTSISRLKSLVESIPDERWNPRDIPFKHLAMLMEEVLKENLGS